MALSTRERITSAIERVIHGKLSNLYIGDVYDEDGENVIGIFIIMYDSLNEPHVASLVNGVMNILPIVSMTVRVTVDKVEGVYSFPVNNPNVSRVTLIELYKKLESFWVARNEANE